MMNCPNSTTAQQGYAAQSVARVGDRASSGHGFSHAVPSTLLDQQPFARLFDSRSLRRASAKYLPLLSAPQPSAHIMSTSPAKLDSRVSHPKSITSNFLIDNFQQVSSHVAGSSSSASFASFASSASCISNRPCPRLESPVSHRKQTIAPISNRPKFAFCNLPLAAPKQPVHPDAGRAAKRACPPKQVFAKAGRSQLSTVACGLPSLIANETHSRKRPNACKQSTYRFLIANEIQRAALTLNVADGPKNAPRFLFITIDLPHPALDSRLLTLNWQRRALLPLAHRGAIIAPENLHRGRGEIRRRDWGNETWH